jgi:hypothetical protein
MEGAARQVDVLRTDDGYRSQMRGFFVFAQGNVLLVEEIRQIDLDALLSPGVSAASESCGSPALA